MAMLRSPDGRLRIDLALRAKGRAAEAGEPVIRVTFERRAVLHWTPLWSGHPAGQSGGWRCVGLESYALYRDDATEAAVIHEIRAAYQGASPDVRRAVRVRCGCGGVLCVCDPPDGMPALRFPRGTVAYVVDRTEPGGFARLPADRAQEVSPLPLTGLLPNGSCAALDRRGGGWLLALGRRPADLPGNPARDWLAASLDVSWAEPAMKRVPAPSASAVFNCTVPFVVTPVAGGPRPMRWAAPGVTDVTGAHAAALRRVRESERACDDVRWLRGEIGEYLLLARRTGRRWRLSALTDRARTWTVWLPFLERGVRYRAVWRHDPQPGKPCYVPLPAVMDAASRPLIYLAAAGGFTLDLAPIGRTREE